MTTAMSQQKKPSRSRLSPWLVLAFLSLRSTAGWCQEPATDSAAARSLFDEGRKLLAAHRYVEACPKFEASARLAARSVTVLNLADCYEKQGKLATARFTFLKAAALASRSANQEREQEALARAGALASEVPKLQIHMSQSPAAGIAVTRDGEAVDSAQWEVPIPVDLGRHLIVATAPGKKRWQVEVVLEERGKTLKVVIPALEAAAPNPGQNAAPTGSGNSLPPEAQQLPGALPSGDPEKEPVAGPAPRGLGSQRTVALVAGGVGVAGVVLGTAFGLKSKAQHDEGSTACGGGTNCPDQASIDILSAARRSGNLSTVAFVAGAAGLAAGTVLWLTAKSPSQNSARPTIGLGLGTVQLRSTW